MGIGKSFSHQSSGRIRFVVVFLCTLLLSLRANSTQVTYQAHVANLDWLGWVEDGVTAGDPDSGNQVEAVQIKVVDFPSGYGIRYRAHVADISWQDWVSNGTTAGTTGLGKRMEAIQIELTGFPANYHVVYRACVRDLGWLGWKMDGDKAGTTDQSRAMLGLEIKIDQGPTAAFAMTAQGQTAYENGRLNLSVPPGGTVDVWFSADRSRDPDGVITQYEWLIDGNPQNTNRDFPFPFT
ncbi:MAG: hypothetical protein Q8Q12_09185, partial [bacterium]|nr:hypothetical protein [bacterium]